jgi:RND superfamily putative drug exporter
MELNTDETEGSELQSSDENGEVSHQLSSSAVEHWNNCIQKWHKIILVVVVVILWPLGFVAFKGLSPKTDSSFRKPIPKSPSALAEAALERKFPNGIQDPLNPSIFVVLHSTNKSAPVIENHYVQNRSLELQDYLRSTMMIHQGNESNATNQTTIKVTSYFSFQQQNLTLLGRPFVSSNKQTTLLEVQYATSSDADSNKTAFTNYLIERLNNYFQSPPVPIEISMTGLKYFSNDLRQSTQQDLKRMDMIVLPLALVLVGIALLGNSCMTKGFYLIWIIPLCGMITTVSAWSLVTNVLADHVQITQFTPSIMMSLTLGMGIDYTLFLLARYLERRQDESKYPCASVVENKANAILDMLQHGGLVVVVSGCTLLCTFLGLIGLPLVMLQSVGVGAAIAIASAIITNLIVVPSLLYTPLGDLIFSPNVDTAVNETEDPSLPSGDRDVYEGEDRMTHPLLHEDRGTDEPQLEQVIQPRKSVWIWLSRHILHPYKSIICLLLLSQFLFGPLAWNTIRLKSTDISFESLLPSNAPSLLAYRQLYDLGGPGRLAPFRILLDGTSKNATIDSENGFDAMHELIRELKHLETSISNRHSDTTSSSGISGSLPTASFSGIAIVENIPIPYPFYLASKRCSGVKSFFCNVEVVRALNVIAKSVTSNDRMATFLTVALSDNPFSDSAVQWLDLARKRIKALQSEGPLRDFDVHIEGTAAIAHDAVTAVYSIFPWVIAITVTFVFVLLGLFFGSIVPPLRSVVSISCTLSASFGLAVLVYQDEFLSGTHIRSLVALDSELSWLVPIMSFSILVGLALDYDVFLVTRILELRCSGYKHKSSIAAGLDATGGIITAAGIIMAVSFGSLLSSASPALNQWSFLLTTGVLIDTFVVRTLVVPALMAMVDGKHAWYPRRLEDGQIRLNGFDSVNDDMS